MTARPSLDRLRDSTSSTWMPATAAVVAALDAVLALADDLAENSVVCECGHDIGGEHNSFGCYARFSYQPLVTCGCELTDDQDAGAVVADRLRGVIAEHVEGS